MQTRRRATEMVAQEWLAGVTYRPGWAIKPAGELNGREYVVVTATEPDVCNPGQEFRTSPLFAIPESVTTREAFLDWVLDVCIPGVEQHERFEWFRIDGAKWRDPHAPGMPAFATNFEDVTAFSLLR